MFLKGKIVVVGRIFLVVALQHAGTLLRRDLSELLFVCRTLN